MRADHRAALVAGSFRPPEQLLVHHHQAGDRQRQGGQVRHEHDVVRGVGARHAEAAGVPGDGSAGIAGEPGQGSHRRLAKQRLPVPDSHFRPARPGTRCGRERPGAERQVVRPHPADRSERAHITLAPGEPAVRHALPPVGDAHREPERRGQIRLVKTAEQLRPAVRGTPSSVTPRTPWVRSSANVLTSGRSHRNRTSVLESTGSAAKSRNTSYESTSIARARSIASSWVRSATQRA
jgi:hypothetical protein